MSDQEAWRETPCVDGRRRRQPHPSGNRIHQAAAVDTSERNAEVNPSANGQDLNEQSAIAAQPLRGPTSYFDWWERASR